MAQRQAAPARVDRKPPGDGAYTYEYRTLYHDGMLKDWFEDLKRLKMTQYGKYNYRCSNLNN